MVEIQANFAVERCAGLQKTPGAIGLLATGSITKNEENLVLANRHRQQAHSLARNFECGLMGNCDAFHIATDIRHFHQHRRLEYLPVCFDKPFRVEFKIIEPGKRPA